MDGARSPISRAADGQVTKCSKGGSVGLGLNYAAALLCWSKWARWRRRRTDQQG